MFLAVEIIHAKQQRFNLAYHYPWLIAFTFGLLHGFGFAGALTEIGLNQNEFPVALLFFNIGVELGQLAFVFALILLYQAAKQIKFNWPDWTKLIPAYSIGTIACYWLMLRVGDMFIVTM